MEAIAFLVNPAFWSAAGNVAGVAGAGMSIASAVQGSKQKSGVESSIADTNKAASEQSAAEKADEKKIQAARAALFAEPTSGFGPNKNLARSFLTSL